MTFSDDNIVAAIIGKAAFLAPAHLIVPLRDFPPLIRSFSIFILLLFPSLMREESPIQIYLLMSLKLAYVAQ